MLVVDSCVWTDFFNGAPSPARATLRQLLAHGETQIIVPDLVLCEVLRGLRDERHDLQAQTLLQAAEDWARGAGHRGMLLDTAMPAESLRRRYARTGYADIASVQWEGKAYRSVVMAKPLATPAPAETDAAHQAAVVRALWASVQARDWMAARGFLADDATLFWRASGEHLLDADAIIRVQTIYPEGWALQVHEVTPLADGRVHSLVQVRHGDRCFFAHSPFRLRGALIVHGDETWATAEAPPAWRTAEAIGAYRRDAPGLQPA